MDEIARLLTTRYGVAVAELGLAPRGWTGETFAATARDGARLFVKVYPRDRLPPTAVAALPALAELHRHGVAQVSRPIRSTSGILHEWLGDDLAVVFGYIDAAPVAFTFGGAEPGDLIARIHEHGERIASPVTRETFEPPYADDLWATLGRGHEEPASDAPRLGLGRFLEEHAAGLAEGWASFGEIARACRATSFDFVLTHGDWPFNLLRGADGTLSLIDWDELMLAPAERDTWYAGDDPAFWRAYRARRRDRVENRLATAYYVHNRYFEELASFARDVLDHDAPDHRARALALLGGNWMAGLRAQVARRRL